MNSLRLPFFTELNRAESVLIAGAGGGFDVFSGLPLAFNLHAAGKRVFLANLSFSNLADTAGRKVTPALVEVTADSVGSDLYFPEKHLSQWFRDHGREVPIYCFHRTGPRPVADGYRAIVELHRIDTVVLVDGGTDSLMRGDEDELGTPVEDMTSIAAVNSLDDKQVPRKLLVCLGFGIDAFHGVCHAHVLEAVADLVRTGGYLGAFSLVEQMPEVQRFREATEYVLARTAARPSIVLTSILSALEGRYGDYHRTDRTWGSELFINPLMAFYWCFRLDAVARRVLYLDGMRDLTSYVEVQTYIDQFHLHQQGRRRRRRELPM
jgi:hypothetical protein